jgi:thiol-disulfide isomerase/thioredoxin
MTEIFKKLFQNAGQRPSGNLFNRLKTEEDSCDSFKHFKTSPDDNKLHLFMFYAPWCGYCKLKTTFLTNLVNNHSKNIKVHTYNCERLKGKDKFIENINGFPSFKMGYKQKTYDTDLLEFIIFAVALATNYTIDKIVNEMQEQKSDLKDDLKTELEQRKAELKRKLKRVTQNV